MQTFNFDLNNHFSNCDYYLNFISKKFLRIKDLDDLLLKKQLQLAIDLIKKDAKIRLFKMSRI